MKQDTFIKHILTSKGLGTGSWGEFFAVQIVCIIFVLFGIYNWTEGGLVPMCVSAIIEFMLFYGAWKMWKGEWK